MADPTGNCVSVARTSTGLEIVELAGGLSTMIFWMPSKATVGVGTAPKPVQPLNRPMLMVSSMKYTTERMAFSIGFLLIILCEIARP